MVASRYENLAKQVEEAEGGLQGLVKDLKRLGNQTESGSSEQSTVFRTD